VSARPTVLLLGVLLGFGAALRAQAPVEDVIAPNEAATPMSAATYLDALDQLADRLLAGDVEEGRRRARELIGVRVAFEDQILAPDASVLGPVATGSVTDAVRQAPRVRALARRLRESGATEATVGGRSERLARLSAREAVEKGGEVGRLPLKPLTLPEQIINALTDAAAWVADAIGRLWDWFSKLWPKRSKATGDFGTTTTVVIVVVGLAVVGGALLAYRALRRRRGAVEPTESSALERSARDEDPLSREAGEWERFAQELAAAGRTREAIRAWYHAVLVTLFRAGALHYEKGRTNWEYVSRLGPELQWRPSFIDLTRWFEEQWYGRDRASSDALRESAHAARGILRALRGGESVS
jgi:Domain of unknown function (DUF4129)